MTRNMERSLRRLRSRGTASSRSNGQASTSADSPARSSVQGHAGGITLAYLEDFHASAAAMMGEGDSLTLQDAVERIILPKTDAPDCAYADLPGMGCPGAPTYVVTASWDCPLSDLLAALRTHLAIASQPDSTSLWIDAFALNLHTLSGPHASPLVLDALRDAARAARGMVLVVDPAGACFRKPWCLLALAAASQAGSPDSPDDAQTLELLPGSASMASGWIPAAILALGGLHLDHSDKPPEGKAAACIEALLTEASPTATSSLANALPRMLQRMSAADEASSLALAAAAEELGAAMVEAGFFVAADTTIAVALRLRENALGATRPTSLATQQLLAAAKASRGNMSGYAAFLERDALVAPTSAPGGDSRRSSSSMRGPAKPTTQDAPPPHITAY